MTIQEILEAQSRAAKACRKAIPVPFRKPSTAVPVQGGVAGIMEAQRNACGRKPQRATAQAEAPSIDNAQGQSNGVAQIIEQQRTIVEAQKGLAALGKSQKEIIEKVRADYLKFLERNGWQDAGTVAQDTMEPPETFPFVPVDTGDGNTVTLEQAIPDSGMNGITVGDEAGDQVTVTVRPRRRRKMRIDHAAGSGQ